MAGLGETLERLARRRRDIGLPAAPAARRPLRMKPIAGFGENPGALRMLLYAPPNLPRRAPLVVVLHGCDQSAEAFAANGGWLDLSRRLGFAVLAPEQSRFNNLNTCFNWFSPGDTMRGRGEAASIAAMVVHAVGRLGLDPQRVFIAGLSAGGAMTAALLATNPELFAGGAIIAGIPYGVAHSLQEGLMAMHRGDARGAEALGALVLQAAPSPLRRPVRLSVWQGEADAVVSPANGWKIAEQWTAALGLPSSPDEEITLAGRRRLVWRAPQGEAAQSGVAGTSVVELNLIAGLGHGAPLSTYKAGDVGTPAPYMLEAGVSSTLEIAGFWGLGAAALGSPASVASTEAIGEGGTEPGRLRRLGRKLAQVLRALGLTR